MTAHIVTVVNHTVGYLKSLLKDIPEERMAETPPGVPNHPAWIVGHVIFSYDGVIQFLGGGSVLPEGHDKTFGTGSKPTNKLADYPSKQELLTLLDKAHETAVGLITKNLPTLGHKPNPIEGFNKLCPLIGDAVVFLATSHNAVHTGQLSTWRRVAGLPGLGF